MRNYAFGREQVRALRLLALFCLVAPLATAAASFHVPHASAASSCYQYLIYHQRGAYYVTRLTLMDKDGEVYTSTTGFAAGQQSERIDLANYGLKYHARLTPDATITSRPLRLAGPDFKYCQNGLTVNIATTGTISAPSFEFD